MPAPPDLDFYPSLCLLAGLAGLAGYATSPTSRTVAVPSGSRWTRKVKALAPEEVHLGKPHLDKDTRPDFS
jgi:hypothetical protein